MPLLADFPVVFVHYPTGAGGWFLSSLLHYSFDQTEPFTFDQVGSGHSNRSIQYINNFYKDFLQTDKGKDIIYEKNYDTFSKEQRVAYIKELLQVAPDANKNIPQVISIHCQNINLFLEALPHAKCVQITISDEDLLKCTFNYLFKILAITPFNFETFCAERGIINDQFELAKEKIKNLDPMEQARIKWDLVIPSVLLDAGAGAQWKYHEKETSKEYARSEGLGVASFHLFMSGAFSHDKKSLRSDATGLQSVTPKLIEEYFQVNQSNPLVGVEGRANLLKNLGRALENKTIFKIY